jgi:enoyl-CoA hydratase
MTTTRTTYALADDVATITLDDGKANALSEAMLGEIAAGLDRAEADGAKAVVLAGRPTLFSAGFDLKTEGDGWPPMLTAGARLAARMLAFPAPVVVACRGHAIAMGAFLLLSADHRVGAAGDGRIGLNEVAIGLTLPWFGIALARHRLTAPAFDRCTVTGVLLDPAAARAVGFLDEVVPVDDVDARARAVALELAGKLAPEAHRATKLRVRREVLAGVEDGIARLEGDGREW